MLHLGRVVLGRFLLGRVFGRVVRHKSCWEAHWSLVLLVTTQFTEMMTVVLFCAIIDELTGVPLKMSGSPFERCLFGGKHNMCLFL